MSYIKQTWENNPPSTATPISASRLSHLETQYDEAISTLEPTVSEVDTLSDTVNTGRLSEAGLSAMIAGAHSQNVAGAVSIPVEANHLYDLTATSTATVTLTGAEGTQVAIRWSGAPGTVEGQAVSAGQTWEAMRWASGWVLYEVGGTGGGGDGGLSGTGSPEGSRPATVGTIYTDTAATLGAIRWIKASGTGATGWKVLYGDTGPRSLPLPEGLSNGLITIQRYADEVTIRLQSINNSAASPTTILALPLGWRPLTAPTGVAMVAGNAPTGALTVASNWDLVFSAGVGNFRHAILKYQTPDPWPTILPGTAA